MRFWESGFLKKTAAILLSCAIVFWGVVNDTAHAMTYVKDDNQILVNQAKYDFKKALPSDVISSINEASMQYVQITITSGTSVVAKQSFDKTAESWEIKVPASSTTAYDAQYYMVDGLDLDGTEENKCYTKNFTVGAINGNLTAKTAVSTKSQNVTVTLNGVSSTFGIKTVKFVFCNESGKAVYAVAAKKNSAAKYSAKVDAAKIKPGYGKFTVKAEITDNNSVKCELDKTAVFDLAGAYTNIKIGDFSWQKGTFKISTDKIYTAKSLKGVKSVTVKTWCKGETTDPYTYKTSKDKKGQYSCEVDVVKQGAVSGVYTAQVIVKTKAGKSFVVATRTKQLNLTNFAKYGTTSRKNFTKKIYIYNPTKTANTYLSVASAKSKNADIKYYKGSLVKGRLEFTVKMKDLKHSGKINMVYCTKVNGKYSTVKKYTYTASDGEIQKTGWYYEKASNGKKYKYYYKKGKKLNNLTSVLKLKKEKKIRLEVNRKKNRVTAYAYDEDTKSWCIPIIAFKCSVGVSSTPTPSGTYKTDRKHRWKMLMGPSWGQYATHFVGGIYFHSIAGSTTNSYGVPWRQYNKLGNPASHGCIRLTVRDAKWIYDHAAIGSTVSVYDSEFAGPLGAQFVPTLPAGQNYDPTDPAVKKKK